MRAVEPTVPARSTMSARRWTDRAGLGEQGSMPSGCAYPGSQDDLGAYRDFVARHGAAEVLGAKNPYTSRNGWMTSFLDPDGLICLRLSRDDRTAVISAGGDADEQYGRNLPDFASVPGGVGDAGLDALFAQSWDHVGTLTPKERGVATRGLRQ